jgi:hypothetical protein
LLGRPLRGRLIAVPVRQAAGLRLAGPAAPQGAPETPDSRADGQYRRQANTVYGTLGCVGNNPPPTNAGQANTAGAKAGQCAGL